MNTHKVSRNRFNYLSRQLRLWNYIVAAVHGTSFAVLLILSIINRSTYRTVRLYTDFDGTNAVTIATYQLFYTLLPFPFITAVFHLMAAADVDNYKIGTLIHGVNRLRWVEYAITNSLITVSLLTLVDASNLFLVLAAVFANISMQYAGSIHEKQNHKMPIDRSLWPIVLGFAPYFAIWGATLTYNIANIATSSTTDIVAVWGSFVFSLMFVVPLLIRFYARSRTAVNMEANYNMELFYIILSLTAKLFLDWTITIGEL